MDLWVASILKISSCLVALMSVAIYGCAKICDGSKENKCELDLMLERMNNQIYHFSQNPKMLSVALMLISFMEVITFHIVSNPSGVNLTILLGAFVVVTAALVIFVTNSNKLIDKTDSILWDQLVSAKYNHLNSKEYKWKYKLYKEKIPRWISIHNIMYHYSLNLSITLLEMVADLTLFTITTTLTALNLNIKLPKAGFGTRLRDVEPNYTIKSLTVRMPIIFGRCFNMLELQIKDGIPEIPVYDIRVLHDPNDKLNIDRKLISLSSVLSSNDMNDHDDTYHILNFGNVS